MLVAGIDAGSRAIKVVLLEAANGAIASRAADDQGVHQAELAEGLLESALSSANASRDDLACTVATGYGRAQIGFADKTITEITCHGRGVHHEHPGTQTVIDIGGQDSKLIRLENGGSVRDFAMNDRCAAGTGRFLEVVAERLQVPLKDLGVLAEQADAPAAISSMCVVFAETEIIGLLAAGESRENITAGVQNAIASRMVSMAGRMVKPPIIFTGGVALVPGMDRALAHALDHPVAIAKSPQFTGALGAALLAGGA